MTTWLVSSWSPVGDLKEGKEDVGLIQKLWTKLDEDVYWELCGLAGRSVVKTPLSSPQVKVSICGEMSSNEEHHQRGMIRMLENRFNVDRGELRSLLESGAGPQELTEWNGMRKQRMEWTWREEESTYRIVMKETAQYAVYSTTAEDLALEGKCGWLLGREGYAYGYGALEQASGDVGLGV